MNRRAPPFAALRVVEAVCRHGSYTLAGQALGVSHSAISQQVQRLEESLGVVLFVRRGLGMEPTPVASRLAKTYADANRMVEGAIAAAAGGPSPTHLTLSMMPSMASLWLAPRLADLRRVLPDVSLNIQTSRELADLPGGEADVAIRFGAGNWTGVSRRLLFHEEVIAVCTPEFASAHGLAEPADLARAPLLLPDTPPWSVWFSSAGVSLKAPLTGLRVDDASLAVHAALAGLGAALLRPDLVQAELDAGRLIQPFAVAAPTGLGCYLVWMESNPQSAAIATLGRWLDEALYPRGR